MSALVNEVARNRLAELKYTPEYCRPERLVFYALCHPATPSHNELRKMHFAVYKRLRESYAWQLRAALGASPAPKVQQAALLYVRHASSDGLDWDNAYGGLKPLQDCLVKPGRRAPSGLYVLEDDSPRHMPYAPFVVQAKAAPGDSRMEVFVFDLLNQEQEGL